MKHLLVVCVVSFLATGCTEKGEDWYVSNDLGVVDTFTPEDTGLPSDIGPAPDAIGPTDVEDDANVGDGGGTGDAVIADAAPSAGPTWANDVRALLEPVCSGCHGDGAFTPFMADDATLEKNPTGSYGCNTDTTIAQCIYELAESKQMPLGCEGAGTCISDDGLATIKAWVDAGAP